MGQEDTERKEMKQAVFHTTRCAEPTTVASARVARYLSEKLNCPLYDDKVPSEHYERIFVINSMGAFSSAEFRLALADQVKECRQLVYCQQDYTIHPISQTQKVMRARGWSHDFPFKSGPILWTTVPRFLCKPQDSYVNWNCLTYQPLENDGERRVGIVYWGSFRQDRAESFARYFNTAAYWKTFLCAPQVYKKFYNSVSDESSKIITVAYRTTMANLGQWKHIEQLAEYEATLYLEDDKQHGDFHSLANRFYEALSAGLAIFVDHKALTSFEKAGLAVKPEWVVTCAQDVERLLPHSRRIAAEQRELWAKAFREDLDRQVMEAYRKL